MHIYIKGKAYTEEKTKQRGSARAEKGQSDADNGKQGGTHSDIYGRLGKYHGENADTHYLAALVGGDSGDADTPQTNCTEKYQNRKTSKQTKLFTNAYKYKIVKAFRDNARLGETAFKEALTEQAAVCKGHSAAPLLVTDILNIGFKVKKHHKSGPLIVVHNKEVDKGRGNQNGNKARKEILPGKPTCP